MVKISIMMQPWVRIASDILKMYVLYLLLLVPSADQYTTVLLLIITFLQFCTVHVTMAVPDFTIPLNYVATGAQTYRVLVILPL